MFSVSIIICTIENSGREERLRQVVEMLHQQQQVNLEIILVFQGDVPGLVPKLPGVRVVMTDLCSSAESRNRGARHASHPLLCFLDDDTFPVDLTFFVQVEHELRARDLDFLTCNIKSVGEVKSGEAITHDIVLGRRSIIAHMWEPGLCIRRSAFEAVQFDPTLGIGCIHGSSEGFDFGVRLLAAGKRGRRIASLLIDHPELPAASGPNVERAFFYGLGNGAALIQHGYYIDFALALLRTAGRLGVSLLTGRGVRARSSFVRLASLCAGPFLPRRPARLLPPKR